MLFLYLSALVTVCRADYDFTTLDKLIKISEGREVLLYLSDVTFTGRIVIFFGIIETCSTLMTATISVFLNIVTR